MVHRTDKTSRVASRATRDGGHKKALPADLHEVIAQLSHDLRTPLGVVLGFTDLVLDGAGGPLTERQRHFLDHVRGAGQRITAILERYLKQAEAGRPGA